MVLKTFVLAGVLAFVGCGDDEQTDSGSSATTGDGGGDGGADGGGEYNPPAVIISDPTTTLDEDFGSFFTISWSQEGEGSIRFELTYDGETVQIPAETYGTGDHAQRFIGYPYSTDISWKLIYDAGAGEVTAGAESFRTGDLPEGCPTPSLVVEDPDSWEPTGNYLLGSINQDSGGWTGGTYWKWVLDRKGRVVWAHKTPESHWTIFMRVSMDGTHIVWDEATYWSDWDASLSTVHRWYLDGTEIDEIATPGLHHAFTELEDGALVWGSVNGGFEDLVKKAPDSDEIDTIWSCQAFHRDAGYGGSCQSNTLYHHQPTDTFLFSFYTTSNVVEIDHATGDTLWWAGGVPGGYQFDPPDSQFSWQHGVYWTDEDTLLLSTEDTAFGPVTETYVREYVVDHDAQVIEEIWNFGQGGGVYASTAGEAHRLPNGNTLHNYGSGSQIKEVTPDGTVVWHLDWGSSQLLGRTVFVEDLWSLMPPE